MTNEHRNGHVEFHAPAVQLTAEMPEDERIREQLPAMKATDGYEGSCGAQEQTPNT